MGRTLVKSISKNLSITYSQKLTDHAKQSATDVLKTASKRAIQKTAEATGDWIKNKNAERNTSLKNFTTEKFRNKWRNT